jgi:hypothetical protein
VETFAELTRKILDHIGRAQKGLVELVELHQDGINAKASSSPSLKAAREELEKAITTMERAK